jgi:hypothetical protein
MLVFHAHGQAGAAMDLSGKLRHLCYRVIDVLFPFIVIGLKVLSKLKKRPCDMGLTYESSVLTCTTNVDSGLPPRSLWVMTNTTKVDTKISPFFCQVTTGYESLCWIIRPDLLSKKLWILSSTLIR